MAWGGVGWGWVGWEGNKTGSSYHLTNRSVNYVLLCFWQSYEFKLDLLNLYIFWHSIQIRQKKLKGNCNFESKKKRFFEKNCHRVQSISESNVNKWWEKIFQICSFNKTKHFLIGIHLHIYPKFPYVCCKCIRFETTHINHPNISWRRLLNNEFFFGGTGNHGIFIK